MLSFFTVVGLQIKLPLGPRRCDDQPRATRGRSDHLESSTGLAIFFLLTQLPQSEREHALVYGVSLVGPKSLMKDKEDATVLCRQLIRSQRIQQMLLSLG
jgi:hypothetical protein